MSDISDAQSNEGFDKVLLLSHLYMAVEFDSRSKRDTVDSIKSLLNRDGFEDKVINEDKIGQLYDEVYNTKFGEK